MLSPTRLACVALFIAAPLTSTGAAHAEVSPGGTGAAGCGRYVCVKAEDPGTPGKTRPAGGSQKTQNTGSASPTKKTCTYKLAKPQPPAGSLDWEGHEPGDGAVYKQTCMFDGDDSYTQSTMVWAADPPEAQVDPAVLAQQAVDKMLLKGPQIGITPKPGGKGVVGMPVYMWTGKSVATYGPTVASASAGATTVTATARVSKIVWSMGDGKTVTCTTAGTPYRAEYGKKPSPDCGHRYTQPSSTTESGKYRVSATSTWTIDWQGGGQTGQLTEVRDSAVNITVAEVQVLN